MSSLQITELKGIAFKYNVICAVCHDDFCLFAEEDGTIHTFDTISINNTVFPQADKKSKVKVTALDFSPSQKYAAAGYEDGRLLLFDIDSNKLSKVITKPNGTPILSVLFQSDSVIISIDASGLFNQHKISATFNIISIRDSQIAKKLENTPVKMYQPTLYRFINGKEKSSKIILSHFMEIVAMSMKNSFVLYTLNKDDLSLKQFLKIDEENFVCCFNPIDTQNLLMAVSFPKRVDVYLISTDMKCELKFTSPVLPINLSFLAFLSKSILLGFDEKFNFLMISIDDNVISNYECPINGFPAQCGNTPSFFTDSKLWRIALQPFRDSMESFREANNYESAIEFCKKAIAGDAFATIGLPPNAGQRILVIEDTLSPILSSLLTSQLNEIAKGSDLGVSNTAKATQIADYFIGLSKEMKIQEWIINEAVALFDEKNLFPILIEKIINADPDASIFTYTNTFTKLMLEKHGDVKINNFIMHLPNKVAPPAELLQYANKANDMTLISGIFTKKLNDMFKGLQILGNADMYNEACLMIIENPDRVKESILWLFSYIDGGFPNIENLHNCPQFTDVVAFIELHIAGVNEPITFNDYVNAMIQVLCGIKVPRDDIHLIRMTKFVTSQKIKLLANTLNYLVTLIFSEKEEGNKNDMEELLIYILSSDVPGKFKESLLQLCDSFGYEEAKRRIREDTKKHEGAIKEYLIDPSKDVFGYINELISKNSSSKKSIRKTLFTFAPIYITRDVERFVNLIIKEFKDAAVGIIREVQDDNIKCVFIHSLYKSYQFDDMNLSSDTLIKYVTFLCRCYPNEVCSFIRIKKDEPITNLVPICEKYSIYDALALIYDLTKEASRCTENILKYEQTQFVLFAEGKYENEEIFHAMSFILEFVDNIIKKRGTSDESRRMAKLLIQGMALPLYAVEKDKAPQEKVEILTQFLRQLCVLVANLITYPVLLEILVVEFQELKFGLAKSAFLSLMNDYAYDVDTTNAMCMLYRQDEVNEHSKYILNTIKGVVSENFTCCTCKRRIMGVADQIQIFPCGHIFHINSICLSKQICPVCNPTEKLDQDVAPPTISIPSNRFKSQLRRFEFVLQKRGNIFKEKEISFDKKDQIVINPIQAVRI